MGERNEGLTDQDDAWPTYDPDYGYCNSCGEELMLGDECCDDGEWEPASEASDE